jgi:predicted phosphoribosyltransferase
VATVGELSDPYANFMLNPEPRGEGICEVCSTFTRPPFSRCIPCDREVPQSADAILPISYSVHRSQLHRALAGYKRLSGPGARQFQLQLSAVLWRFLALEGHEDCLAAAVGVDGFEIVTTVPSSSRERDAQHPLPQMIGGTVQPTADRFERLLRRSSADAVDHEYSEEKFEARREIDAEPILLIDDTWTRGANAQSASAALKAAGAGAVGVLVIGRHVHEDFGDNKARLRALPRPFDWKSCWLHT